MFARFFGVVFIAVFLSLLSPAHATADEAGVKVVPAFIEESVDPGAVITQDLSVTNVSDEDKEYYIYVRNISGVEAGGVPVFASDGAEKTGYEIADWVELQSEPINVPAGESAVITVTIRVPVDASPGSHFGGVFVSAEPPRFRELGASVGFQVATIISIRISGDIIDDARVRSFSTDRLFYGTKNVGFALKIENRGNILIRPRGPLTITSLFGGTVANISVNENLAGVFPGTVRDINVNWSDESLGFGRYEAVVALSYEGKDGQKTIDASTVFWIFPLKIILPVILSFVAIFLIGYFLTKYYINQAIMRAAGGRRIIPQRYRRQVGISRFTFVSIALMGLIVLFLIVLLVFFA